MSRRLDILAGHALAIVVVIVITFVGYRGATARVSDVAAESHTALCAFKNDLQRRRQALWEFREAGRVIGGITTTDLNRSLANQQATLDSLSSLECA